MSRIRLPAGASVIADAESHSPATQRSACRNELAASPTGRSDPLEECLERVALSTPRSQRLWQPMLPPPDITAGQG